MIYHANTKVRNMLENERAAEIFDCLPQADELAGALDAAWQESLLESLVALCLADYTKIQRRFWGVSNKK